MYVDSSEIEMPSAYSRFEQLNKTLKLVLGCCCCRWRWQIWRRIGLKLVVSMVDGWINGWVDGGLDG